MTRCPVCQNDELIEDSEQMLCCSQCGFVSHSQGHFQSQQDEGNFEQKKRVRVYRTLETKRVKIVKEKAPERPWKTDEGFQLIMMEQVNALIELDASPELKEAVFYLWALYLKKCGRAFTDEPLPPSEKRKNFGTYRIRDKYPGTVDNPKVYPHHIVQMAINSLDDDDRQDDDARYQLHLRLAAQKLLHVDEKERNTKSPKLIRLEVQAIQFMTMSKTLCFLYLGLKLTNHDVQIYDLIRWVNQERLPYLKLPFWPSEMKFYGHDNKTFIAKRAPTVEEMFGEVIRLVTFMDLNFLDPPDIRRCARKIAYELNLPDEFIVYLDNLIVNHHPTNLVKNHFKKKVEPATLAMSYIVVTLKLLLGLDGNRERKITLLSDWLSKRILFDKPLFNFTDWMLHIQNILCFSINNKTRKRMVGIQQNVFTCKTTAIKHSLWFNKRVKYLGELHSILKSIPKTKKSLDKHGSDDDDDDDDNLDDDDDDSIKKEVDDERNESTKEVNLTLGDDDGDNDRSMNRHHVGRKKNPFKGCTLEYFLDQNFFKRLLETADDGDDDDDGRGGSRKAIIDRFEKGLMLGGWSSREIEGANKIRCKPVQEGLTLTSIFNDLPKNLRPGYKPKYILYRKRLLRGDSLLQSYSKMFAQKHKTRKAIWEDMNDNKSDSYLDVLELCSGHINVTPIYLENRLQKLEIFIFTKGEKSARRSKDDDDDDYDDDDGVDDDDDVHPLERKRISKRKKNPTRLKRKINDDDDEINISRDGDDDDEINISRDDDDEKLANCQEDVPKRKIKRRKIE